MTADLDAVVARWARERGLATAWAMTAEGRDALERAGVHATLAREAVEREARDAVLVELDPRAGLDVAPLAKLATSAVIAVTPNARRVVARGASIAQIAPILWEIGRVRERAPIDVPAFARAAPRALEARVAARLAAREVYLVDVTPRTRQAKRKLLRTAP